MLYAGAGLGQGDTKLVPPRLEELDALETGETDDFGSWARWREAAVSDHTVIYFAVEHRGQPVGEIFIHDINLLRRSGMVGYRIFNERNRGRGIGTQALRHVVQWATTQRFDRLYGIAHRQNVASCALLQKCGFAHVGTAREDPARDVFECVVDVAG